MTGGTGESCFRPLRPYLIPRMLPLAQRHGEGADFPQHGSGGTHRSGVPTRAHRSGLGTATVC